MNRAAWILAGLFVVLVVVLIFMFGDDDGGETTTSSGETTTTLAGTTTSAAEPTTTAGDETTTTTGETTTTTAATTTTSALEGNWSETPVVAAGFGALGWWDGSAWVQVEAGTALPVSGGEDYQVAVLGLQAITTGGAPTTLCEPLNNPGVELDNHEQLLGDWPGPYGVAISANWVLVPHLVEEIEDDGTYAAFAGELLAERGLNVPDPVIKQLIRLDLEGDGVNEVLVIVEDVTDGLFAESGDYSIAFLRRTVQGDVHTAILGDSVIVTADGPLLISFSVGGVADLNGDGKMEIILSSAYYEGLGVEVWEYIDDDQGPVPQISQGCGV